MTEENGGNDPERAGRYILQPAGYRAFIPAQLPPRPPVRITSRMQTLLSAADRALGRLDGAIHTLPESDLFTLMYIRKEAVLSSQIEGTQSSLRDVLAAEARLLSPRSPGDEGDVINYVAAMNYGLERLQDLPLSVRLIREIHEKLLHGIRGGRLAPGELRQTQNWIGAPGSTVHDAVFVPPPFHEVPRALGNLETFLHRTDDGIPPLVRVGLAHAQFETIHPFLDGNGRIGRLLIAFFLCNRDILSKPVLYISYFFKRYRTEYYECLQAVRDTGDWEGWLAFFLRGVVEVGNEAVRTARRVLDLREGHRAVVTSHLGRAAGNSHRLLEALYREPVVTVSRVQEIVEIRYQAANTLVARLVALGILEEISGRKRNRAFLYRDYIRIFADDPEDIASSSAAL
ncbi:MAG: Fic family protein [Alphaproteobacteria bacterium]|nr:Fic family protein [Alphaproteobacteria bacterium]